MSVVRGEVWVERKPRKGQFPRRVRVTHVSTQVVCYMGIGPYGRITQQSWDDFERIYRKE